MFIQSLLEQEHSKAQTMKVVNYVGADKHRFKELMHIFLKGEYRLTQRAAWPMSYCAMRYPELIKPYFDALIKKIQAKDQHPAVTRNILRLFQDVEVPEKHCGLLLDLCLAYMRSEMQATAIRAFSITVASGICQRYPDLKNELILVLEELQQYPQLPAVNHRIKKELKALRAG